MDFTTGRTLIAFLLTTCLAFAAEPAFEVASITPCEPGTPAPEMEHTGVTNFVSPGGRFRAHATTIEFLMEWAYGLQPSQHSKGPGWFGSDRFDIVAKADHDATENEEKLMVRSLLADRFRLRLRRESKEVAAYVVSVGKSAPKLFAPKDGEVHAMKFSVAGGPDQKVVTYHVMATRYTLAQLTDVFARRLDRAILDKTGMAGEFDFALDLTPDDSRPNPTDPSLLLAAMKQQLGLNIQAEKAVVDYYEIEGADKSAAAN